MAGEGPGAAAIETGFRPAVTETPKTTETPITPLTPATAENATGENPASNLENSARQEGDHKALEKFATASSDPDVFKNYQKIMRTEQSGSDEPNIKPDENPVTFANVKEYRQNFAAVPPEDINASTVEPNKTNIDTTQNTKDQLPVPPPPEASPAYQSMTPPEEGAIHQSQRDKNPDNYRTDTTDTENKKPIETSDAYQSKKDTNPDLARDQAEPPVEAKKINTQKEENVDAATAAPQTEEVHMTKTPGEIVSEIQAQKDEQDENGDEKNENTESEKQKRIDEMINMANITSQMKDINPKFNPKDPDSRKFLENLAENPNKMELTNQTLKMLNENKKTLENLGIDPKEVNKKTVEAMAEQIKKKTQEQANNPDPKKQEENKENSENVSLLELLMTLLAAGAMGMIEEVGKEASRE